MTWLARAAFALLVGATFASFFVAQRLKGAPPVVEVRGLTRYFSPNGDGRRDGNRFAVRLEQAERVTVDVVDALGDPVRRLASDAPVASGRPLPLRWNGRSDDAAVVPDGPYRLRVNLLREGRSVEVSATTNVDTTPPRPRVVRISPGQLVGPLAPSLRIGVRRISFRYRTCFRVVRTDDGPPRVVARFSSRPGVRHGTWDGKAEGVAAPPGVYLVRVSARDRAGNLGTTPARLPARPGDVVGTPGVTVRGIAAQPPLRPVTAGSRAEFFVDARRRPYAWRIRRAGRIRPLKRGRVAAGEARPLTLRAPSGASGLYLLQLRAGGDTTSVPFAVQASRRAALLVVVPAITWLGTDQVDDGPGLDGLPNTLPAGGPVKWPRVFAGTAGLPRDFAGQVAPLLVFLDRAHIRYDLTTDLDLAVSGIGPRASDRPGVLLAGPQRWITRGLARRLRRYAADGGTVASFGVDTLRRGVTVRVNADGTAGSLLRPTQPTPQDPFGARLGPLRRSRDGDVALELLAGNATFGLLTGFDGQGLGGFDVFEPSMAPEPGSRERLLAGIGTQPAPPADEAGAETPPEPVYALTAARVGKGVVIRVGLPQWAARLRQPAVRQITSNIVDLLRGVKPRLRSRP